MKLVDLSQTIEPSMPRFSPGAPAPEISAWQSHAQAAASGRYQDCTCEISQVSFITSLGTYLDSPYHFYPDGPTIERLPLEAAVLPGLVVDCPGCRPGEPISPAVLAGHDTAGKAVLFHTGWSRFWGAPEYFNFPFLSSDTARALVERGARLAGVDCLVVDDPRDPRRPAHVTLLGAGVLIVENLANLSDLPPNGFIFHAAPVKFAGAAAFPVRAYAVLDDPK